MNNHDHDKNLNSYLEDEELRDTGEVELSGVDRKELDMLEEVRKYNEEAMKRRCNV